MSGSRWAGCDTVSGLIDRVHGLFEVLLLLGVDVSVNVEMSYGQASGDNTTQRPRTLRACAASTSEGWRQSRAMAKAPTS